MTEAPSIQAPGVVAGTASSPLSGGETQYVVLAQQTEFDQWKHVGQYAARSAEQAVRRYAENVKAEATTVLVAVPVRSWNPVRVKTKVETTLVIEEAS